MVMLRKSLLLLVPAFAWQLASCSCEPEKVEAPVEQAKLVQPPAEPVVPPVPPPVPAEPAPLEEDPLAAVKSAQAHVTGTSLANLANKQRKSVVKKADPDVEVVRPKKAAVVPKPAPRRRLMDGMGEGAGNTQVVQHTTMKLNASDAAAAVRGLSDDDFFKVVNNWRGVKGCVKTAGVGGEEGRKSSMRVSFTIAGNGNVTEARVTDLNVEQADVLSDCVEKSARNVKFPTLSGVPSLTRDAKFLF